MAFVLKYGDGSGPLGAGDGSSPANAWGWAEMLTNQNPGEFVWWKGNTTTSAATQVWANAASATPDLPLGLSGYITTPGDDNGGGGDVTGQRVNFVGDFIEPRPKITNPVTGGINGFTIPKNSIFNNMGFSYQANLNCFNASGATESCLRSCEIEATGINSEIASFSSNYVSFFNCDFKTSSTSVTDQFIANRVLLNSCRFIDNGAGLNAAMVRMTGTTSAVENCIFIDAKNCIKISGANVNSIRNNSFQNCRIAIESADPTSITLVAGNVAWGDNSAGSVPYIATAGTTPLSISNNAAGNFELISEIGNWPRTVPVALGSDPFTGPGDVRLNDVADGGALCKNTNIWGNDIGAVQSESTGGGGNIIVVEDGLRY